MGGNGAYNKALKRIMAKRRTHREYHDRIGGHKILLQNRNPRQVKLPVKSNSGNTIYLSGRLIGKDIVEVTTIGIYRNHNCVGQIDLKFDTEGNFIPYSKENKDSSHFHLFFTDSKTGETRRKSHDKTNTFPIDSRYSDLIQKIVNYNKQHKL